MKTSSTLYAHPYDEKETINLVCPAFMNLMWRWSNSPLLCLGKQKLVLVGARSIIKKDG